MNNIIVLQETDSQNDLILGEVFKLRHETFIDRLDWDVVSENGIERDEFDNLKPYHIAVMGENNSVKGCWRALPTTSDYMLKDIFPELLQGEEAPQEKDVWEISRFAVRRHSGYAARGSKSDVSISLVKSFYEFAVENGIRAYVTVTTVACERLLRQLGLNLRRMGRGEALEIGKERSVALWIEVDKKLDISMH